MGRSAIKTKPNKPYPSFPLTPHANGQWCKKIRGRVHFFGVWADPDVALSRYHTLAADLHSGRNPSPSKLGSNGLTVKELGNHYLSWQQDKMDSGEIGSRWFEDCRRIITDFAASVGRHASVCDLSPPEFQRYRTRLAKRIGVHALTRHITAVRSMFKYAYESDLIEKPIKFGSGFAKPTATQKRKAKSKAELENGKKLFTPTEIKKIISKCDTPLLGPVLLGINGGFGNTDCATLTLNAVDLDAGLIVHARPKTGVERVVPLWPETIRAIKAAVENRPEPEDNEAAKLVFLTPTGKPLVRQTLREHGEGVKVVTVDFIVKLFPKLLKDLGLHRHGLGFYSLRHTFRTWADEVHDQHAIHRIMGHAIPGMSGVYVEDISVERLRKVVDYARSIVFGSE